MVALALVLSSDHIIRLSIAKQHGYHSLIELLYLSKKLEFEKQRNGIRMLVVWMLGVRLLVVWVLVVGLLVVSLLVVGLRVVWLVVVWML